MREGLRHNRLNGWCGEGEFHQALDCFGRQTAALVVRDDAISNLNRAVYTGLTLEPDGPNQRALGSGVTAKNHVIEPPRMRAGVILQRGQRLPNGVLIIELRRPTTRNVHASHSRKLGAA